VTSLFPAYLWFAHRTSIRSTTTYRPPKTKLRRPIARTTLPIWV